jgi:leucyl-tRNA synthetase
LLQPFKPQLAAADALELLMKRRRLSLHHNTEVNVRYIPSREAKLSVINAFSSKNWPDKIQNSHCKAFRTTNGAIFRFPAEDSDESLEVFITDWSPCPAAGAVAIHKDHPFIAEIQKKEGSFFSGKFVRHPLTGDLLPVWVADWVKPEFGTGAVLVNPAHDFTDLQFGRKVGLPIRFGLVPETFTGKPETWPTPPVIKTGKTIKTGLFDGLSVSDAIVKYFDTLQDYGLAERCIDYDAGIWKIATLVTETDGCAMLCKSCWSLAAREANMNSICSICSESMVPVAIQSDELLETVLSIQLDSPVEIVCPSIDIDKSLLFLRLLFFDLYQLPFKLSVIHLVHKVQETKSSSNSIVMGLASLVGAPPDEIVVTRHQIIEQVERFLNTHSKFMSLGDITQTPENSSSSFCKAMKNTKAAILAGEPSKAFRFLYTLQKELRKMPEEQKAKENPIRGYFALAHVLLGLNYPNGLDIHKTWKHL